MQLGITYDQSSKWQQLAAVPKDEFEKAVNGRGPIPKLMRAQDTVRLCEGKFAGWIYTHARRRIRPRDNLVVQNKAEAIGPGNIISDPVSMRPAASGARIFFTVRSRGARQSASGEPASCKAIPWSQKDTVKEYR